MRLVPKSKTATGNFYKNAVLKNLRNIKNKKSHPKTGTKCLRLLHDNTPLQKACIVNEYLEAEKVTVIPHTPCSQDLAPCNFFLFTKFKLHLSEKLYKSRNITVCIFLEYDGCPY